MPCACSRLSLASAVLVLAGMPSLAAARFYVKLYLTWNNAPFDGYHSAMSAIVSQDGVKVAGNPFNVARASGSNYGLIALNGTGDVTIDTKR